MNDSDLAASTTGVVRSMLATRGWVRESPSRWLWVVPGVGDTAAISVNDDGTYTVHSVAPSGKAHTLRSIRGSDLIRILNIVESQHPILPAGSITDRPLSMDGSVATLTLRIGPERWGPPVDAVSISAKYPGSCVSCGSAIAIGDEITGTSTTGWACGSCVRAAGTYKQRPNWAIPVGAQPSRLRFETRCIGCGEALSPGTQATRDVVHGYVCGPCILRNDRTAVGVASKAVQRAQAGNPLNLTLADIETLVDTLHRAAVIDPERRGDQEQWPWEERRHITTFETLLGLFHDAIQHRFNPNPSSKITLDLLRALYDPQHEDERWDQLNRTTHGRSGVWRR